MIWRHILLLLALMGLASSAHAQSLDSLVASIQAKEVAVRIDALRQWTKKAPDVRVAEPLLATLRDSSPDVRCASLRMWSHRAEEYARAIYSAHLPRRKATYIQLMAAEEAQKHWQQQFLDAVTACTTENDPSVRQEAVRTLIRLSVSVEEIFLLRFPSCLVPSVEPLSSQAEEILASIAQKHPKWLLSLVHERDPQTVFGATMTLVSAKFAPVFPVLIRFLQSPDALWRAIGCNGLAVRDNSDALILPLLGDADARVRERAIDCLKEPEKIRAELVRTYPQANPALRWSAVKLAADGEDKADAALLQAACRDTDKDVLMLALRYAGTTLPSAYLRELLLHQSLEIQCEAIGCLWRKEKLEALPVMLVLLERTEPIVIETVMEQIDDVEDARLPDPVLKAFRQGKFQNTDNVVRALSYSWQYARPLILQATNDTNPALRVLAIDVVGDAAGSNRINEADFYDCVSRLVCDSSDVVRQAVAKAIAEDRFERVHTWRAELMLQLLEDTSEKVCLQTFRTLRVPNDAQMQQKLEAIILRLIKSKNPRIAETASDIYADLKGTRQ